MKLLVLDDDDFRHAAFKKALSEGNELIQVHTYTECLYALENQGPFDIVYLDHDLNDHSRYSSVAETSYGRTSELTGEDVARYIACHLDKSLYPAEIIVHSWNPAGAHNMLGWLRGANIKCSYRPFHGAADVLIEEDHIEPNPHVTNRR